MARIRTIKPEFNKSPSVARLSDAAQLFMLKLLTEMDDQGRIVWLPRSILGNLYPFDESKDSYFLDSVVEELEAEGIFLRYVVDGVKYGCFPKWLEHQVVKNPSKPRCPEPPGTGRVAQKEILTTSSVDSTDKVPESSPLEMGNGKWEMGATTATAHATSDDHAPDESPPMSPLAAKLAPILQQIPAVDRCGPPGLDGIDEVLTDYGEVVKVKDWPEVAKSCRDHFKSKPAFGVESVHQQSAAALLREFVRDRWLPGRNRNTDNGKLGSKLGLDEVPDEIWEAANRAVTGGRR